MGCTRIAEKITGRRVEAGTELPVLDVVERQHVPGRDPEWVLLRGLVNGVADGHKVYETEAKALAALARSVEYPWER